MYFFFLMRWWLLIRTPSSEVKGASKVPSTSYLEKNLSADIAPLEIERLLCNIH